MEESAELEITMRFNHSMLVSYVQPSMDAAIAGDYKDLRFKNNLDAPVYIEGYCSGGVIYFNVYGKETRPANREISFESETVSTTDPETKFNLDSSLAIGYWSVDQSAHTGCVAQLWKIVKVDGEQQSRDLFNKSNYKKNQENTSDSDDKKNDDKKDDTKKDDSSDENKSDNKADNKSDNTSSKSDSEESSN